MALFERVNNPNGSATCTVDGASCLDPSRAWMNYLFAAILILCFLISTLLNPVILIYHWRQRSVAAIMFQLLSVFDFITNLYYPVFVSYNLLKPAIMEFEYENSSILLRVAQTISVTGIVASAIITSVLCTTRYINIKWPFFHIKRHLVLTHLAIVIIYSMTTLAFCSSRASKWSSYPQYALADEEEAGIAGLMIKLMGFLILLHTSIAIILSFFTSYELFKMRDTVVSARSRANNTKSCVKIMLMADAQIAVPVFMLYGLSNNDRLEQKRTIMIFATYCLMGQILSAYNPLLMVMFSTGIQNTLKGWGYNFLYKMFGLDVPQPQLHRPGRIIEPVTSRQRKVTASGLNHRGPMPAVVDPTKLADADVAVTRIEVKETIVNKLVVEKRAMK